MIEFMKGDLLDSQAHALVNTVNCVGVMGKGIALQFKKVFPDNYEVYREACKHNRIRPGKMFIFKTGPVFPMYVINFPTKQHWKNKSKMKWIVDGLTDLRTIIRKLDLESIAIPALGCNNGGLNWRDVKPIIVKKLSVIEDTRILIYEPREGQ